MRNIFKKFSVREGTVNKDQRIGPPKLTGARLVRTLKQCQRKTYRGSKAFAGGANSSAS